MAQKTGQNAIKYSIITAFSKKGIDAAEKGLKKLRDSFKKTSLGSKLTFAAIGAGLTALAAKSLAAAKEQDKLQRKLEFSLKTMGETTAIPSVNRFLDTLERQTGIASDTLIPAFMSLARVTKNMTDAYDALNLALDIAAITGDDVSTIADAMAKGFTGSATSLAKLIPGLSKATIKAADMQKIMKRLNDEFGGAAQGTMDTYASKLAKLKVSVNKSLEVLGAAIINLLQGLTKTTNIEDLGVAIEKFAKKIGYILEGLPEFFRVFFAEIKKQFESNPIGRLFLAYIKKWTDALEKAADAAARYGYYANERRMGGFGPRLWEIKNTKEYSKIIDKIAKKKKKKSPLADFFDLEKAALAAAKRQALLSKEEQTRIEALQALKSEDKDDDEEYFKKLVGLSAEATRQLIADQNTVAGNLKTQLDKQLKDWEDTFNRMVARGGYFTGTGPSGTPVTAPADFGLPPLPEIPAPVAPPSPSESFGMIPGQGGTAGGNTGGFYVGGQVINVEVNAGAIGSEDYLVGVIGDSLAKYIRTGNSIVPAGFTQ